MKQKIKRAVKTIKLKYYKAAIKRKEIEKIEKKKPLWYLVTLDGVQSNEISKKWGTDDRWHRYYQYFTGNYDIDYYPEILFSTELEPLINERQVALAYSDKSMLPTMFGDVVYLPKTILRKSYGRYFDGDGSPLLKSEAFRKVKDYLKGGNKVIIKPSVDTCSGQGVNVISSADELKEENYYKDNYIVQELVENQSDIKALNPSSLNTMRVMTYICENKIFCAPILLRMGCGTSHLDNAHAGGIFVAVNNDGTLGREAYSEYGEKHTKHPYTQIQFEGYQINGVDKVINCAIACHRKFPMLGMISWDLTINANGDVTLIEANMFGQSIWLAQIAHGRGVFEQNTEKMRRLMVGEAQ